MEEKKEDVKNIEEVKVTNTKTIKILFLVVGIVLSLALYMYFKGINEKRGYNKQCDDKIISPKKDEEKSQEQNVLEPNEISVTDAKVTKFKNLFDYEEKTMKAGSPSIFRDVVVIASDLSSAQKKTIALHQYLRTNTIESVYVKCNELTSADKFDCDDDNNALINGVLVYKYIIKGDELNVSYQEIFGRENSGIITGVSSFTTPSKIRCNYIEPEFHCINLSDTPIGIETVTYPIKAYDFGDRLEVLSKYVWIESGVGYSNFNQSKKYFEGFTPKTEQTTETQTREIYNDRIDTYRYTFLKLEDGSYIWEKIEPVVN